MKRLWNNSFVGKIFFPYLALLLLLFAAFFLISGSLIRHFHIATLSGRMEQEAHLLGRILPLDRSGPPLDEICRDLARGPTSRITVIDPEGRVLGDSAEPSAGMENQAGRPEIAEALRTGSGTMLLYGTTERDEQLYRAFRQTSGEQTRIVRIAVPLKEIAPVIGAFRRTLLTGLLLAAAAGLVLAWAFSYYLTRRLQRLVQFSEQVAQGSFPQNAIPTSRRDEIALLEHHLNDMSLKIRDNLDQVIGEKEKAASILRCMIEGVLVVDSKGHILVINDQAKAMFKVPADRDVYGASLLEISRHPDIRFVVDEVLAHNFNQARYSKEMELDDERWFRVNAAILRDGTSTPRGTILVFHNISDIKRLERVRSDLVANVSHELRTPLTAIRGYVETLLYAPPKEAAERQQFLEIIDRHSERLTRLTEDLLTLSDLESGKAQMTLQPTDAAQLVQRVLEIFWERAHKKAIRLLHVVEPGLPLIAADPDRLQQLLINLIDNAVKYTPTGGQVTVAAAKQTESLSLELSVSDTGPGIPEKDLPRLTERFYRVDKARSRELGGTGLGLAIVKHIVQAHRGELKFESTINKGTTVRVWLPMAQREPNQSVSLH